MPTVNHWAWNGNARRYWDNMCVPSPKIISGPKESYTKLTVSRYGGKLQRIERQGHHYGSGLNALPLLSHFQSNPSDLYALQVGFAGMSGPLSNIDSGGFASASFHTWPDTLAWDAYSGDYGPNFLGLVLGSGTYVVKDPDFGIVAYGGHVTTGEDGLVTVVPRDAVRRKVYLSANGLRFAVDAGAIESLKYGIDSIVVTIDSSIGGIDGLPQAKSAILWVDKMSDIGGKIDLVADKGLGMERGGWKVDLTNGSSIVNFALG